VRVPLFPTSPYLRPDAAMREAAEAAEAVAAPGSVPIPPIVGDLKPAASVASAAPLAVGDVKLAAPPPPPPPQGTPTATSGGVSGTAAAATSGGASAGGRPAFNVNDPVFVKATVATALGAAAARAKV